MVRTAAAARGGRPLVLVDLALPRDLEPQAATIEGVAVIALETLADSVHNGSALEDVAAVGPLWPRR